MISALSAQQHFRRTEKGLQLRQKPQAATRVAADSVATNSSVASAVYTIVTPAALTTPTPGTQLLSSSVNFTWDPGNTAKTFQLFVGTTGVGSHNVYNSGAVTATTEHVNGLPTNGSKVYVRLYWLINGTWSTADYTYKAQ